jgi:hypothetical protein
VVGPGEISVPNHSPEGPAADVLHGTPASTTYEDTLQALGDGFGVQHFAAAYRCQLTTRTQTAGESLQDFATAIEQLAHLVFHNLSEEHISRDAGKAFSYGVRDPDIKVQLLLGGEKTVSEALRKALELHAVMVSPRPHQNTQRPTGESGRPSSDERTHNRRWAGVVRNQVTSKVVAMDTHTRKEMENYKETKENHREDQNGDRITAQKEVGTVANGRETDEGRRKRAHAGICIKAAALRANRHHKKTGH